MSGVTGPNIVTDGLVLTLDAGNAQSYPGSGTTWYDVAGSSVGTITNATYSSTDGGSIAFDGNGDYIDLGADLAVSENNIGWAAEFWFRTTTASTLQAFSSSDNDALNANWMNLYNSKIALWNVSPGYWKYGDTVISNNTWYQVVYVSKVGGTQYQFYVNGEAEGGDHVSNTWVAGYSSLDIRFIGMYHYISSNSRWWNGNMAIVRIYNREITAAEVLQNFNAHKSRFGL